MNQNRRDKRFPVQIEEKLQMFREETYVILKEREQIELKEKKRGGEVSLTYTAKGNTLIFLSPENHVLSYLDGQKKGATACADIFLFKLICESGKWELHIIEFKKTVNLDTIGKSKWQFTMGIYNARAVAAFLGIEIQNIFLYSGFRNDKLTVDYNSLLITLRASNNTEAIQKINQWNKEECKLNIDGKHIVLPHKKICLDQAGYGEFSI